MSAADETTVFEPTRIYTAAEVAEKLRLSRSSVLQRARSGDLPNFKLGPGATQRASVRFLGEDVNAWLDGKHSTSGTRPRRPATACSRHKDRIKDFARWREERRQAESGQNHAHHAEI